MIADDAGRVQTDLLLPFFDPPCNTPAALTCAARLPEGFYFSLYLSAPAYALML